MVNLSSKIVLGETIRGLVFYQCAYDKCLNCQKKKKISSHSASLSIVTRVIWGFIKNAGLGARFGVGV